MSVSSVMSEPLVKQNGIQIYNQLLIPLLEDNGFELISRSDDDCGHNRYITRHRFVRQTPLRPYIWERNEWPDVDVIGIPMGNNFLIIHAMLCHSIEDNVKIKIRTNEPIDGIRDKLLNEFVVKLIEFLSISINDLPLELKFKILSLLPINGLFRMALVSNHWRAVTLDDQLWRILVKQHFPAFYYRGLNGENWKTVYKEAFRNRKLLERRKSWASRGLPSSIVFPALPPSPPLLPIMGPPFIPMLPPPPAFFRDLVPDEIHNAFPNLSRNNAISRPFHMFGWPDI